MKLFEDENDDNEMFDALFESIIDCGFILAVDGQIFDVSRNTLDRLGYRESDLVGRNILDFTPPGFAQEAYKEMWALNDDNRMASFESLILTGKNTKMVVEVNCHFAGIRPGGLFVVTYRDVVGRKEVESMIAARDYRQRVLVESMDEGFLVLDSENNILEANSVYAAQSGYTRDELLKMKYQQLLITPSNPAAKTALLSDELSLINNFHKTKSGEVLPLKTTVKKVFQKNKVDVIFVFTHNIIEYMQIMQLIQKDRLIMKEIINSLLGQESCGIILSKPGEINYINNFMCNLLGYSQEEVVGRLSGKELARPNDFKSDFEKGQKVFKGELPSFTSKMRLLHKDGAEIPVSQTTTRQLDNSGNIYVLTRFELEKEHAGKLN